MFPFWRMTESPGKFPPVRIASIPQLDRIPNTKQVFSKIHQNQKVSPSEINEFLSNCITSASTFTQVDTLKITYSITLLLLRSWEGRRLTNWSPGQKTCLVSKERHNSDLGKFLILWYLLASMTPRKWKLSRRNTEEMHSPFHMASMP